MCFFCACCRLFECCLYNYISVGLLLRVIPTLCSLVWVAVMGNCMISTADKKLQESLCVNFYWKNDIYHFYSKHEKLPTSICLSSLYAFRYSMLSRERLISKVYGSSSSNERKLKILFLCKCSIYMVIFHILNTIKYIYIFQLLLYLFYSLFLLHSQY